MICRRLLRRFGLAPMSDVVRSRRVIDRLIERAARQVIDPIVAERDALRTENAALRRAAAIEEEAWERVSQARSPFEAPFRVEKTLDNGAVVLERTDGKPFDAPIDDLPFDKEAWERFKTTPLRNT